MGGVGDSPRHTDAPGRDPGAGRQRTRRVAVAVICSARVGGVCIVTNACSLAIAITDPYATWRHRMRAGGVAEDGRRAAVHAVGPAPEDVRVRLPQQA